MKQKRLKKCRICKEKFSPKLTLQVACSPKCAIEMVNINNEKKKTKRLRQLKNKNKTRSEWLKEAQIEFNKYIRERDKYEPCISCGTTSDVQYAAGHYKTVGAYPELRFHEMNVHKQCNQNCNSKLSGNIIEYRKGLIEKIGVKNVEWIEGSHESQNLTIEDIQEIKKLFKEKTKQLILLRDNEEQFKYG